MSKEMPMAEYVNFLAYMRKNHPEVLDEVKTKTNKNKKS